MNKTLFSRGLFLVFLTALISGVSIFVNGMLVKTMSPSIFTFSKNTVVALLLVASLLIFGSYKEIFRLKGKQWLQLVLIGLVGGSIPFLLFFKGLSLTNGTMGAFIHKTMFLPIAIMAYVFLRERLHPLWMFGALLLFLGNMIFLKVDIYSFQQAHYFILAATLFWAVEQIISKHALKAMKGITVAFGRMFFGALFMLAYLVYTGEIVAVADLGATNIHAVLITAIFLLAYVGTWYTGLKTVPVSVASCVLLLGAPITTLLKAVFLDKAFSFVHFQGALLLLFGIIAVLFTLKYSSHSSTTSTA